MDILARRMGYEYVAYHSLDEARADNEAIVILQGDSGGQIYLTCPVNKIKCAQATLAQLLDEMGCFAWGDGEEMYFERVSPHRFVSGGMGGGCVEDDVWIHPEFRDLLHIHLDILPDVKAVIDGHSDSILPGVVGRLVACLESLDVSEAFGQGNYGHVGDIANALAHVGKPAAAAIPVLRTLEATGKFRLADVIRRIEEAT